MAIRWLLIGLLATLVALAGALAGAGSLADRFWPRDPTEAELADLGEGYEVIDIGAQECGQGGSYRCSWTVVVAHERNREELQAEIQRVTHADLTPSRGQLVVEELGPGRSKVEMIWGARDPGPWELFGTLGLLAVALMMAALAVVILIAIVARRVANTRGLIGPDLTNTRKRSADEHVDDS